MYDCSMSSTLCATLSLAFDCAYPACNSLWTTEDQTIYPQFRQRDEVCLLLALRSCNGHDGMTDLPDHDALAREGRLLRKVPFNRDLL